MRRDLLGAVPGGRVDGQHALTEHDGRRPGTGRLAHARRRGADRGLEIGGRREPLGDALQRAQHGVAVAKLAVEALQFVLRLLALEQRLGDAIQHDEGHRWTEDRVEQELHPEAHRVRRGRHHDQLMQQHHPDDQGREPDPREAHLRVQGRGGRSEAVGGPGHHPVHRSRASVATRR